MCSHADDTTFVQILRCVFADVRNIGSKFLHTTFCFTNFERVLVNVNRSKDIFTNHTFVEHDSILVVVTLPRHERHFQVTSESKFSLFGCITFCQDIAFLYALTFWADRAQVDSCALVRLTELRNSIFFNWIFKAYEFFVFSTVVADADDACIDKFDNAGTFGHNLSTWIVYKLSFNTGTHNRSLATKQWNCLAHHVRTHQRTVGVVVFQERNQRCRDRCNLHRRYVHQLYFFRCNYREVGVKTRFNLVADKRTVVVQRSVTLSDNLAFFDFSSEVSHMAVVEVNLTVLNLSIWSLDKSEIVDFSINTQRRNQTDVRTFRCFNRTKTTVVSIVHVTNLETSTVTGKTARTEGRHSSLVSDFGKRVSLVHELRKCVSSEECVDNWRNSLRVDQVNRSKHFVVADIHTFTDSAGHTSQTDAELVVELLAYRTYTTVAQVVDIVNIRFGVDQFNQVSDDGNDILLRQHLHLFRHVERQFLVDTVTSYLTEVVTFFREEQVSDYFACARIIGWFCVTQLTIDIMDCLLFRVTCIFLESIENDCVIARIHIFLVQKHCSYAGIKDFLNVFFLDDGFTVDNYVVTLDWHNFASILVYKVFNPCSQNTGSEFSTDNFFQVRLVNLNFLCQSENFDDVLIAVKTDSTQQCSYGQFFLTVDVSIHHVVDVCSKFNPGTSERNDTCGIQLCSVSVSALSEEHTRRTVKLGNNYTFCTVDDESTLFSHIRDRAQIYVLNNRVEVLVVRVSTIKLQLRL